MVEFGGNWGPNKALFRASSNAAGGNFFGGGFTTREDTVGQPMVKPVHINCGCGGAGGTERQDRRVGECWVNSRRCLIPRTSKNFTRFSVTSNL
jgi:hypothetical protein